MIGNEWELITFTLLMQTAIGVFLASLIMNQMLNKTLEQECLYKLILPNQFVSAILAVTALVVSVFHLGYPLGSPRAILNLDSSWLSREIVLSGTFVFLCLVVLLITRSKKKLPVMLSVITSLVGLVGIFAMSKVYSTVLIPAWQSEYTIATFYGTCFMLGTLLAIGTVGFSMRKIEGINAAEIFRTALLPVSMIAIVAIAVQTIVIPGYMVSLSAQSGAGQTTAQILTNDFGLMLTLRWSFIMLSTVILILTVFKQHKVNITGNISKGNFETAATSEVINGVAGANYIYLALVAMIAAEIIGRYLFYTTGVQIMIGG